VDTRLSPRRSLSLALTELPDEQRRAVELRVLEDLPYREIARRLSIRPAAARLRVSRALRRLAIDTKEEL
jgi:RNA polymerase sigma-70 factor (ECF subfamily)